MTMKTPSDTDLIAALWGTPIAAGEHRPTGLPKPEDVAWKGSEPRVTATLLTWVKRLSAREAAAADKDSVRDPDNIKFSRAQALVDEIASEFFGSQLNAAATKAAAYGLMFARGQSENKDALADRRSGQAPVEGGDVAGVAARYLVAPPGAQGTAHPSLEFVELSSPGDSPTLR